MELEVGDGGRTQMPRVSALETGMQSETKQLKTAI